MSKLCFVERCLLTTALLVAGFASLRAEEPPLPSPVAVVRIANSVLSDLIDRDITRDSPVRDNFHGTVIVGTAHTQGRPQVQLHDNPAAATFDVLFTGTTMSQTQGHHAPVVVYSHSSTKFSALQRIVFEPGKGFQPSTTTINSNTQIVTDSIATNRRGMIGRMIERRAWGEVAAQSAEGTAFAKANTEKFVVKAFDEALAERLAKLNEAVDLRFLAETYFKVKLPPVYQCSTHKGYVQMAITTQPGTYAELNLPKLKENPLAIQLWLHKSLLNQELPAGWAFPIDLTKGLPTTLPEPLPALMAIASTAQKGRIKSMKEDALQTEAVTHALVDDWLVFQFTADHLKELAVRKTPAVPVTTAAAGGAVMARGELQSPRSAGSTETVRKRLVSPKMAKLAYSVKRERTKDLGKTSWGCCI